MSSVLLCLLSCTLENPFPAISAHFSSGNSNFICKHIIITSAFPSGLDSIHTHRTLFSIGRTGEGWMTTHSWRTHLSGISSASYCSDKKTTIAWAREGEGGRKGRTAALIWQLIREVSEYNLHEPLNPNRSLFFFSHVPLHPHLELQIMPCVSLQARWEIRSEMSGVSAIWVCCSFRFIYFIPGVYLSLCRCMNVWFLVCVHMNVRGLKVIKMDSLFVRDLAQIVLYSSMYPRYGRIAKRIFLEMLVCLFLRELLFSVCFVTMNPNTV